MTDGGPRSSAPPSRSLPATHPAPAPAPLIAPTGSPGLNSVIDVVNNTAAPFQSAPSAEKGVAGAVAQGLGGVLGVIGAPQMIIDTAFASLTAPIAALFPALPAITLGGMHIGTPHTHMHPPSLIPPAPPVPLPSIGALMGSGSITVLLGGMPAARAGDIGIAATCGSLAPPFCVYTGSSNVFIGGARAARLGDITQHCNPQGGAAMGAFAIAMSAAAIAAGAAGALAGGSPWAGAQAAADAAVLAMRLLCGKDPGIPPCVGSLLGPPVPNVLIGGFPCPPIGEMAVGGILKALKALGRALKSRVSKKGNAQCANGSHPIYLVTGENFDQFTDFVSGGLFEWKRHYTTGRARIDSPLGHGFRHFYQRSLALRLHRATFTDWDGVVVEFPRFERGSNVTRSNGYVLRRLERGHYELGYRDEPAMYFSGGEFDGTLPLTRLKTRGRELVFLYDGVGRLSQALETNRRTAEQRRYELRYDDQNHVTHVLELPGDIGPAWARKEPVVRAGYLYSTAAELTHAWDATGGAWVYDYDAWHRWTKQRDPRGYAFSFRYDAVGRCVEASGQDGLWWCKVDYYPDQKLTRYVEGDGAHWEYHYDSDGFVVKIVDPYGGVKVRERDGEGKIVREVDSGGRVLTWLYDADGAHYARMDRFGHFLPPEMDAPKPGNPLARVMPSSSLAYVFGGVVSPAPESIFGVDESVLRLVPPELGSQARLTLRARPPARPGLPPPSVALEIERDALGRKIREVDAIGRTRAWEYDASGNPVARRDRDGRASTELIASWNLVGERRDAAGNGMKFEYSRLEQIVGVTDALGNATRYEYDKKERLVRIHRGGKVRDEYVYDAGDHLVEKRDGGGAIVFVNEPHDNHLVGTRRLASGGFHRFDYDRRGRITEASTEAHEVRLEYDQGRKPGADLRDGAGVRHLRDGDRAARTLVLGRFESKMEAGAGELALIDAGGKRTSLLFRGQGGQGSVRRYCSNGTIEILQYDEAGRLQARFAHRSDEFGRMVSRSASYVYTDEGDLVCASDSDRGKTEYEVDAAHRLKAEISPRGERHEYWQDGAYNVVSKPGLHGARIGAGNRLEASSDESFEYDARDRLAARTSFHDGSTTLYEYDSFDMLRRVVMTDAGGAMCLDWSASYDALGRRVTSGTEGARREFYWDGDRLGAEVLPDGRLRIYQYASREALTPLGFVDYASRDAEPGTGKSHHVFSNPAGAPLWIEDETGSAVWWANRVDPYGVIDLRPDAAIEYNLRWPGHYFDPETRLHYNRYRYYDPALGRYLQSDPIGYEGSPVNLYAYCPNPLVQVDILGLAHPGDTDGSPGSKEKGGDNDGAEGTPKAPAEDAPPRVVPLEEAKATVAKALDDAGVSNKKVKAFGVSTHEDGTVTVAVSGSPKSVESAKARTTLPEGYEWGPTTANRDGFEPVPRQPDGSGYDGNSSTCVEPRLSEGSRGTPENPRAPVAETTENPVWRGDPADNPYPRGDGTTMNPCPSCAHNADKM